MNHYFVFLNPYSQQQGVFIYDENADIFYTALRVGVKIDLKRDLIRLFIFGTIIIGLYIVSPLLSPIFFDAQSTFKVSNYVGLLVPISLSTIFYCKYAGEKMALSLQASQYGNADLRVLNNLTTLQQRQKFFHKLQWRRNMVQVIARFIIFPALLACVAMLGITQHCIFFLLLSVAMVSLFINLVFYEITDRRNCTDLKYLLQKFM